MKRRGNPGGLKDFCRRGHAMTPENIKLVPRKGLPPWRTCRECFNESRREICDRQRARAHRSRRTEPASTGWQPEPEIDIDRAYYEMCRDLAHQRRAAHTADLSRRMAEHRERYGEPHWLTRGKR